MGVRSGCRNLQTEGPEAGGLCGSGGMGVRAARRGLPPEAARVRPVSLRFRKVRLSNAMKKQKTKRKRNNAYAGLAEAMLQGALMGAITWAFAHSNVGINPVSDPEFVMPEGIHPIRSAHARRIKRSIEPRWTRQNKKKKT